MDTNTKQTLIGILTILKQLAAETYGLSEMTARTYSTLVQAIPDFRQKVEYPATAAIADLQRSRLELLRRLDELLRQVDQA